MTKVTICIQVERNKNWTLTDFDNPTCVTLKNTEGVPKFCQGIQKKGRYNLLSTSLHIVVIGKIFIYINIGLR